MKKKIEKPQFLIEAERKLKKIWDVLCGERVVGFTLSVKFYCKDSSEPKTVSIQGTRLPEGDWNTSIPRESNSAVVHSPKLLKAKLASIESAVHGYIMDNALEVGWKKKAALIKRALKRGISVNSLEYRSEVPIRAYAKYGYDAHFCAPAMATAYALEGTEALANNDLERASHCVERGLYWSSPDSFIPEPNDRFKERASTGGVGKDLRREPVKDKVAELLTALAPEEGWESTPAAIEVVANELIFKYSSFVEAGLLKTDNLPRTIEGWVQAEPGRFPHRLMPEA